MKQDTQPKIYLPVVVSPNNKKLSWLTKDRKWNFLFWIGTSILMTLGLEAKIHCTNGVICKVIHTPPPIALIIMPIVFMLFLCKVFNGTKAIKKGKKHIFFNSQNQILDQKLPTIWLIILTVMGWIATGAAIDRFVPTPSMLFENPFFVFIFCSIIFSVFSLYFIIKDCPVSIIFNRHVWRIEPNPNLALRSNNYSSPMDNYLHDRIHSPRYSGLGGNIYYRK